VSGGSAKVSRGIPEPRGGSSGPGADGRLRSQHGLQSDQGTVKSWATGRRQQRSAQVKQNDGQPCQLQLGQWDWMSEVMLDEIGLLDGTFTVSNRTTRSNR
jgi:hypothetical protein